MADEVMKIVSPIIQCSMAQQLWPKMSLDRFPKSNKSARLVTLFIIPSYRLFFSPFFVFTNRYFSR